MGSVDEASVSTGQKKEEKVVSSEVKKQDQPEKELGEKNLDDFLNDWDNNESDDEEESENGEERKEGKGQKCGRGFGFHRTEEGRKVVSSEVKKQCQPEKELGEKNLDDFLNDWDNNESDDEEESDDEGEAEVNYG